MPDLSILIPARNEQWLARTVQDLLDHIEGDTEIIVVLDGAWADPPLPVHERLSVVYNPVAVGQRAACNQAARVARGKWLMKLDAHCSVDQGFDVKLLAAADGHDDWTLVPLMKNMHAFDWVCENGHRRYQSPSGPCRDCGGDTVMDVVWFAKDSPKSTAYCFTPEPKFHYFGEYKHRSEGEGDITETMSLQGSCFMLTAERYWTLGICDEELGSWGSQGIEVACKTWLSGGRVVCVQTTWYGHLFRTQGGDFGFPYEQSGRQVGSAKRKVRELFFENKWPQQVHPLSWLLERFWPVPEWSDEDLAAVRSSESHIADADSAAPEAVLVGSGEKVAALAVGLPSVDPPRPSPHVLPGRDLPEVVGVAARRVVADEVIEDEVFGEGADEPCVHESVNEKRDDAHAAEVDTPVAVRVRVASPDPAPTGDDRDVGKKAGDVARHQFVDRERLGDSHDSASFADSWSGSSSRFERDGDPPILSKGICYYTDNRLPVRLAKQLQSQLLKAELPIVSVSLKPMGFGRNVHLPGERGVLQMFRQILAGLEELDTDVVFLAEHDLAYHPSHFQFVPERADLFYYNTNLWRVRLDDGLAVRVDDCRQTSGLCAHRSLLLEHYRERVRRVEADGFSRRMGFEPGTHTRAERVDDYGSDVWQSDFPNLDIRHGENLTASRWSPAEFRDKRYAAGWVESHVSEVPGWADLRLIVQPTANAR